MTKSQNNPIRWTFQQAARCGAKTRFGSSCRGPAMGNGRCRMHGGNSPGAPKGNQNALKHGFFTAESIAARKRTSEFIRGARSTLNEMACLSVAQKSQSED